MSFPKLLSFLCQATARREYAAEGVSSFGYDTNMPRRYNERKTAFCGFTNLGIMQEAHQQVAPAQL
jgi:hypothetical protein